MEVELCKGMDDDKLLVSGDGGNISGGVVRAKVPRRLSYLP